MGSKKKACECNDVMSQLPDPIIGHILGFLPLNYAVRTCALSREWRYKYLELSKFEYTDKQERYLLGILGVLEAHPGPILDFSLSITDFSRLFTLETFDKISKLVFKKGIRKLAFQNLRAGSRFVGPAIDSSLFSCSDLSHLVLRGCALKEPPPEFKGFTKLVALSLRQVKITLQLLSTIISQSPLLQSFDLMSVYEYVGQLEVDAPNLNIFRFQAQFNGRISVAAPRINQVTVTLPHYYSAGRRKLAIDDSSSTVLQLTSADTIESLHLDHYYTKALRRCGSRVSSFQHLRVLRLSEFCFGVAHEAKWLLDLIESCVSLEKLIIEVFRELDFEDDDVTFDDALDLSCSRIREVQMLDIRGSEIELAFIEVLLLKLLKLETMVVQPDQKSVNYEGGDIYTGHVIYRRLRHAVDEFQWTSPVASVEIKPANGYSAILASSHCCSSAATCMECLQEHVS